MEPIEVGMTVREAAAELGCSEGTVYDLCASGRLPHRRLGVKGRQIRVTAAYLAAYLESCEVPARAAEAATPAPASRAARRRAAGPRRDPNLRFDGKPYEFIK